jgi:drug/metabolite transporter (DMT)-like permease
MNWFILALLPPALWAVTNHIDKYLMERYFKGSTIGALAIFSSLIGVILLPIVLLIHPYVLDISLRNALILIGSGGIYIGATLAYLYALQDEEATVVVPLFQTIPIYSYILALIFLGEQLHLGQIFGAVIVIIGSIILTLEIDREQKVRFKKGAFWLMMLSSFLYATNLFLFKFISVDGNFWQTSFWEYSGFALVAIIIIIFAPKWRKEFFDIFKKNTTSIVSVNVLNEVLNIGAKLLYNSISLLAPLALLSLVFCIQPAFVFIFGIILTLFLPKVAKENLSSKALLQKIIAIAIIIVGTYFVVK